MADIINSELHRNLALYARVSTSGQEDQETIENQIMAIKDFADEKFGKGHYTIIKEYRDDGWSGDNILRPDLDRLRVDATKKIWDGVLIYDPDRLARRYSLQELVMDDLKEAGAEIIFVTVSAPKNAEDKILHGVRGLFAEYERVKISERFRLGKLRKVTEGHILTTEAPYGYQYIRNNKETKEHGYYVINENEAKVVRMIFNWVGKDGLTLRKIVRKLQELEIKPRKSKRGVWSTSTLTTMLRHKAYIGQAHWGSSYAVIPENPKKTDKYRQIKKSSRKRKPEKEWIAADIPVPTIINEDLFLKTRTQLETNFELCKRNTKNEYLVGGKIFCACGKRRCGEGPQHGKHLYYRCSDRVNSFPLPRTCKEKGINARIADKLVWQEITKLMTSPDLLQAQLNRWVNERKDRARFSGVDVEAVKKEITKLEAQVERYTRAYGEGLISLLKLKEYTQPRNKQIEKLELQIRKVEQDESSANVAVMPTANELELFSEAAKETLQDLNFETKQEIIRNTVGKITGTQKQLQVSGNIPLTLNHVWFNSFNRHCWFAERWQVHII